jgi:hypothetical protein
MTAKTPAAKPAAKGKTPARKTKAKPPAKPRGRPTDYNETLAETICMQLAVGRSLASVCREETMPDKSTVFRWLYKHPEFRDRYAYAKEIGCYAIEEEALEIADDGTNDWMADNRPDAEGYKLNGENVQRSRLRVDTRKWFMERIAAKRFGNKVDVNHGVQPENPLAQLMTQIAGKTLKPVGDDQ